MPTVRLWHCNIARMMCHETMGAEFATCTRQDAAIFGDRPCMLHNACISTRLREWEMSWNCAMNRQELP
eukprot:7386110-Prymnesium_polylepis.3